MIYSKKYIVWSLSSSSHRTPKNRGISKVKRVILVSFVIHYKLLSITPEFMLMMWFLESPKITTGWGLIDRGGNHVIRGVELSVLAPQPGGRGAGGWINPQWIIGQWFNQSWLHTEACMKIPKAQGLESFQVGEHVEVLGRWHGWGGRETQHPVPHTCTLYSASLPSGYSRLVTFVINLYLVGKLFSWALWTALTNDQTSSLQAVGQKHR